MNRIEIHFKPKIVVVEDDDDVRHGLSEYLQARGFHVDQASTGVELHEALKEQRYDVAVLDVNLPDVSGFDLSRVLAHRKNIGIIMLTALRTREDRIRGYDGGADLYFTKPVDSEELALAAANLAKRIRQKTIAAEEPALVGMNAWILDRKKQTLLAPAGKIMHLSGRETLLIEFLSRHPSSTIPRMDVLQFYDPSNLDPFSRRFDVAFGRLRSKATDAGIDLPIQVIRGSGVRLLEKIEIV